jgi:outer membrane lipoprotein SlyB
MFYSNTLVVALFLKGFRGLEMITGNTYDSSKALSSSSTGYGCHVCIRNGWVYAVPDSQTWYGKITDDTTAYGGECCDTLANCPNAYDSSTGDNVAAGWKASTVTFASVDMAVHACPFKTTKCSNV